MAKILIGGDFCPIGRMYNKYDDKTICSRFETIKGYFKKADYRVLNLETPLLKKGVKYAPIPKSGPNLSCPQSAVSILRHLNIDMVTLANNHIMDYGDEGLESTLETLKDNRIENVGAGKNLTEASTPKIIVIEGLKFGFISCCEEEFSVATSNTAGAMLLHPIDIYTSIKRLRNTVDYIILLIHGGIEHYPLPTPEMKKLYHFFIEAGTDIIINNHQHCYSGYERLNGKLIFYGCGNFCFDYSNQRNSLWNEGYLVNLEFGNGGGIDGVLIPYVQNNMHPGVFAMEGEQLSGFEDNVRMLNRVIGDDTLLNQAYEEFLDNSYIDYQDVITPYVNRYVRAIYRRGFLPSFFPKKKWYVIRDVITCDAHRGRFIDFLKRKTKSL